MKSEDRNNQCPCGSGKKFKRCYGIESLDCKKFQHEAKKRLIGEHDLREKAVFNFLLGTTEDLDSAFSLDKNKKDYLHPRPQFIISFTMIDVLANYWAEYINEKRGNEKNFKRWATKFLFNEKNKSSIDSKAFNKLSVEHLYHFRCSIVHFCGLGGKYKDTTISLFSNMVDDETVDKYVKAYDKASVKDIQLKSIELKNMIIDGIILMKEEFLKNINAAQKGIEIESAHIEGIKRIYDKFQSEGAVIVSLGK